MKKYYVTRKIICNDTCFIRANSKKEAIQKAKEGKFEIVDEEWEVGSVIKAYNYIAREDHENETRI